MSYRKAVIAANQGGITEFVRDRQNGLLFPPKDSRALADALGHMLKGSASKDLGEKGYAEFVSHFTKDKVLPSIESVYARTLADQNNLGR